jgi:c-di-GMP-binding flagellar brake protein YcgR
MENRRRQQRYGARLRGHIWAEGQKLSLETLNLSASGVRISLDAPLLEGAEVKLRLQVSLSGSNKSEPINVNGVVVWCNEDMEVGYQAGIRFDAISEDHRRYLEGSLPSYVPV